METLTIAAAAVLVIAMVLKPLVLHASSVDIGSKYKVLPSGSDR